MGFVKKILVGVGLNAVSLYVLILLVEEISYTGGFKLFLIAGIVLGLINVFIKPFLKILSLPAIFLTGGLFLIVINAVLLWLLSYFITTAEFRDVTLVFPNVGSYVIGAIVFGLTNWLLHLFIKND